MSDPRKEVTIDYTNWRGIRGFRRIVPVGLEFSNNEWHPETQWLLEAVDLSDADHRTKTFALKNIHSWKTKAS